MVMERIALVPRFSDRVGTVRTTIPTTPPQFFKGDLFDKNCSFPPGHAAAPPAVGDAKVSN